MAMDMTLPRIHNHEAEHPGCTYPSASRRSGQCGRTPVRVYLGPDVQLRCAGHDGPRVEEAALRAGFVAETKAERIAALEIVEGLA